MNVRPLTRDDAAAAAQLWRDLEESLAGRDSHTSADDMLLGWWSRADLENDTWAYEDDGVLVAFGGCELHGPLGHFAGAVHPSAWGRGIGADIVDRCERRLSEKGTRRLHTWAFAEDRNAAELFASRGYSEARRFWEMVIELEGPPPEPSLPAGLRIDEVLDEDAFAFHDALAEAFQDHWEWHGMPFEEWWEMRKGQQRDAEGPLWFVVRDGDQIAATARNEARDNGGVVGALGVRRPWRGLGLGKALLYHTFGEFQRRGLPRVSLAVDAESHTGATKLYESVGMRVEQESVVFEKKVA